MQTDADREMTIGDDAPQAHAALKLPTVPPELDDDRLLAYRHPREHLALVISLVGVAVVALLAATVLDRKDIVLEVVGIWVVLLIAAMQAPTLYTLSSLEVTPTQFSAVYEIFHDLQQRFDLPPTRVFVMHDPHPQAHALGVRAPYVIVLHSALLEALDLDELRVVLGQQCARIRFGHTKAAIIFGGDPSSLPKMLAWIGSLRDFLFAWYLRTTVMSADRIGVLAGGGVGTAIRAQVKLAAGAPHMGAIQGASLLAQAHAVSRGIPALQATLIHLEHATPTLIHRVEAMVEWAGTPAQRGELAP